MTTGQAISVGLNVLTLGVCFWTWRIIKGMKK